MQTWSTRIIGATSVFPERILTNADLEKMVDTNDSWIVSRTGIRTRRIAAPGETTSTLGAEAAKKLLQQVNRDPQQIDGIIVATVTPDMPVPSSACIIQDKIGAKKAWCYDLNAACCGFLFGLSTADQFIKTGKYKNILLIGSEVMSSILDFEDRTTCVLFGDGAGAVYLEADEIESGQHGVIDTLMYSDGSGAEYLYVPGGGSRHPASHDTVEKRMHYVRQEGGPVFKAAVHGMTKITEEILQKNSMSNSDIDFFVPHQANLRIIDACSKRLNLEPQQVIINLDRYGNTTAATIPTCLAELVEDGRLSKGKIVLMAGFGAGFTCGAALVRWG